MTETVLDFSRFEFKYVLRKSQREVVEAELGFFMQLDPFVHQEDHNRYFVRSLYFDDPQHSAFHDKMDGLKHRSKFRIRTYGTHPGEAPVFLEEKGRHDNRVFKHRVQLVDTGTEVSATQLIGKIISAETSDRDLSDKFTYDYFRKQIKPVALIDYYRRPYISKYDHEFRVTFDEELRATETDKLFPDRSARRLLPGYTVMEVKFGRTVPAWFHRIIQSNQLRRGPLSKICEGMQTLNIASEL